MHDSAAIIATRSLTYRYPSANRPSLNHVDLEVRSGEYVAILGVNGSGKSTLLKMLTGLLVPDFGTVSVCARSDPASFRQSVATVLQNPDDQIVATVAEEDVAFGPENLGLDAAEVERRVSAALSAVSLEGARQKPPHFLSGGERQRLSLAGALAMEAPILALDEAASMLDPAGRGALLSLLDLFVTEGKTILHVTHSMEEAARARRVVVLELGRVVFDGTPAQLFCRPELEQWGLELPQALKCARALNLRGVSFNPTKLDPEGFASELSDFLSASMPADSVSAPAERRNGNGPEPHASGNRKAALRFENVSHTYLRGTAFSATAIKGVTLSIRHGLATAIIGPSGSGKSTLLRHGNAVLLPQEGRVLLFGNDTLDPAISLRPLRMRAALSVQNPEAALFSRYVADDVAYGPRNKGLSGKELVAAVRSAMDHFGLPYAEYRDRETGSLSGGEKRKAALAGVFALDAELYLLDEPSAALDPSSRRLLLERLLRIRESGAAVAATTHLMEEAVRFDRVVVMKDGEMAAEGTPSEIFYQRYDPAWGLSLPWAVAVSSSLRRRGIPVAGNPLDASELGFSVCAPDVCVPAEPEISASAESIESPSTESAIRRRGRRRGAGIEFFRNAVFGQFLDRPSPIRSLSPRTKYLGLFAFVSVSIFGSSLPFPLATLALSLLVGAVARVGPRHLLRPVVPAFPYLLLVAMFQVLFSWQGDSGRTVLALGPIDVTADELTRSLLLCARFVSLIAAFSLFSAVTPLSEAVRGVERLLSPLKRIGLPVRDLSMIAAIALRFVPVLAEEAERIATAQLSRGGGYSGRGKVRAGMAMTVPLFLRALERAEALASAMDLRLYGFRVR